MSVYKSGIFCYNSYSKFTEQTNEVNRMKMTTKFIVEKTSNYPIGTLIHYYAGQADGGVDYFVSQKLKALHYDTEDEAIQAMNIFKASHCEVYSFKVISVRCRV